MSTKTFKAGLWALSLLFAPWACGQGKSAATAGGAPDAGEGSSLGRTARVGGQVAMGPVEGATVTAFELGANGAFGANLGTVTTAADGSFSLDVLVPAGGAVAFAAQGGAYVDEVSQATITIGVEGGAQGNPEAASDGNVLQTWVENVEQSSEVAVTALTTMAASFARQALAGGGCDLGQAIVNAKGQVAGFFTDPNGQPIIDFDITRTLPLSLSGTTSLTPGNAGQAYGSLLSGMSQLAAGTAQGGGAGLDLLRQLVAIARQDAQTFAAALVAARADASASAPLDANLLQPGSLGALAQLGAQLAHALPRAIGSFLVDHQISGTGPGNVGGFNPDDGAHTSVFLKGSAWVGGPVAGGTVVVTALGASQTLAQGTTQADGTFTLSLKQPGWVRMSVSGGTFRDAVFDGNQSGFAAGTLVADVFIPPGRTGPTVLYAINPVTKMVSGRLDVLLGQEPKRDPADAQAQALAEVRAAFGLGAQTNLQVVQAADLTRPVDVSSAAQVQVALVAAAAASLVKNTTDTIDALPQAIAALALDLSDGKLDGKSAASGTVPFNVPHMEYPTFLNGLGGAASEVVASLATLAEVRGSVGLNLAVSTH